MRKLGTIMSKWRLLHLEQTRFLQPYRNCRYCFHMQKRSSMDKERNAKEYLFSFGLITDIQYADIPNGQNYSQTRWRYYRNALNILKSAVDFWNDSSLKLSFVLQLGDIIDRHNDIYNITETGLESVMAQFRKLPYTIYHLWGNHEFYNFSRQQLETGGLNSFPECDGTSGGTKRDGAVENNMPTSDLTSPSVINVCNGNYYFKFSPHPKYLFISLDGYDLSLIGRQKGDAKYEQAFQILTEVNKNEDLNSPSGLRGFSSRFVMFNGGFSDEQLKWLDTTLQEATELKQRVIVLSHLPLHPNCCSLICLAWNYQQVLDILWKYSCVEACFYGHDHDGGYCRDMYGIHHRTFEGAIESEPGKDCYATIHCTNTGLVIDGKGTIQHQIIKFKGTT